MDSSQRGRDGENQAAAFFEAGGYRILQRNFRQKRGEIDIIACREEEIVFCEVKSFRHLGEEALEYAINPKKRARIITAARFFLACHPEHEGRQPRFDVVFVRNDEIMHFPDAFSEYGAW